jgi:RimJ/RimL family protein N-acetyltransferase
MFARTERLLLRPAWTQDAPALFAAVADEAIVRNLASAPWPYTLADAEAMIARDRPASEPWALIFRRTPDEPELAGAIGFGRRHDGQMEFGYWVARPFWGLGYATEAGRAVIAMARHSLRLRTIQAGHFLDNPASGRVLEKLGFRPTGLSPRFSAGRGHEAPCRELELALDQDEDCAAAAERMAA